MWTYLNTPFLLVRPGVESEELEPWRDSGETWRRLKVRFPTEIATHSAEQTLYFDRQGLLKRHDYDVEISGGTAAAHYVSDLKEFSGIVFPTTRRIFTRQRGPCRHRPSGVRPVSHPLPERGHWALQRKGAHDCRWHGGSCHEVP